MEDFNHLNSLMHCWEKQNKYLTFSAFMFNLFMESAQAFTSVVGIIYFNIKSLADGTYKSILQPVQQHIQQKKKRLTCWLRITH